MSVDVHTHFLSPESDFGTGRRSAVSFRRSPNLGDSPP
jgi:hypothetical protein